MRRSPFHLLALAAGALLALNMFTACNAGPTGGATSHTASGTIKIATDFPVSSADASAGKPVENGARMAVDEANVAHTIPGYTLLFVPKDDVGAGGVHDPVVGAVNVTTLMSDAEVAGIIGPLNSDVAYAELPLTMQAPIAQISPSSINACLTPNMPESSCMGANNALATPSPTGKVTYFRLAATADYQGVVAADYAYQTLGYKHIFVIDDSELFGVDIANQFVKQFTTDGGRVAGHDSIKNTTDYAQELSKIAAMTPRVDAIYFGGNASTGGIQLRKQMLGLNALQHLPLMGPDTINTQAFAQATATRGAGPVYSTVAASDPAEVPAAATFVKQYQARYGSPGAYSASSYDCAMILIDAIKATIASGVKPPASSTDSEAAKTFRQAVIDALKKTDYQGVTGHQQFDIDGNTTNKTISIYQLADTGGVSSWKFITARILS